VVDDDNDDGESAKKIETRLALAISKPRIDNTRGRKFATANLSFGGSEVGSQRSEVNRNAARRARPRFADVPG